MSEEKKKTIKRKAEKPTPPKKTVRKKAAPKTEKAIETVAAQPPAEAVESKPVEITEKPPVVHHVHHAARPKKIKPAGLKGFYGTGRRKSATARAWITAGSGNVSVNNFPAEQYFCRREVLLQDYNQPFALTGTERKYDVKSFVKGGGVAAQADALRMAIARAMVIADPALKQILRSKDMLKRDPREKERKKYGLKRARRAFQFTKR